MIVKISKIGNSKGIRLNKAIIEQCHFEDEVEITVVDKGLLISPILKHPRENWEEQFRKAIEYEDEPEGDVFEGVSNSFDDEEWTWPETKLNEEKNQ